MKKIFLKTKMQMEKRKKCQGGCAGQVLDILPAVQAGEERNCGLVKILGQFLPGLQRQESLGAKSPCSARCSVEAANP